MLSLRTRAAVWSARAAAAASQRLGRGGGTAISGLVALKLQPSLNSELAANLGQGNVVVTGTNGKTTTSMLLAEAARAAGLEPVANGSGSNMVRGVASSLALQAGSNGASADQRLGVFEVDEANIPLLLPQLQPRAVVFLNLFRDQLDRYGEVEAVANLWRSALANGVETRLVLNADDPAIASLGDNRDGCAYFGIEDTSLDKGRLDHASDAINCRCGARLTYGATFLAQAGHWRCENCGRHRPQPTVSAEAVDLRDGRSLRFRLRTPGGVSDIEMALGGLYNVYNALAAATAAYALGLPSAAINAALSGTAAAFGRQEVFDVDGKRVELYLGKNPAGLNQVLSTLLLDPKRCVALIILNDGIADGRDISWIWDADFELAAGKFEYVVVSGTRAEDMALRLKYAEWDETTLQVEANIEKALDLALARTGTNEPLSLLPTYTAMLNVRGILAQRTGRKAFWQ